MRSSIAYLLQVIEKTLRSFNLDTVDGFSQDGANRRVKEEKNNNCGRSGLVISLLLVDALAPTVNYPEAKTPNKNDERHKCEHNQSNVIQP